MISVKDALEILHNNIPKPVRQQVKLDHAYGCYLCEDVFAPESSPRYTNSAMDGFALRFEDCEPREQAILTIIGESQAGVPFDGEVMEGSAVRISTGAMLPNGADTVVRIEDTREFDNRVEICRVNVRGQDVRHKGEEFEKGAKLFGRGTCLRARELAQLAAVGIHQVPVYIAPDVSLLVTGTELAKPDDENIKPHQIRDSNAIMLASAVRDSGAILKDTLHVHDSLEHTTVAVKRFADSGVAVILCSGGVSVGKHDHVKEAALAAGFVELFWKIRQKPGKPLFVSRRGESLLFGLPGNPVSAFMCFNNYVRPVLAELQGTSSVDHSLTAQVQKRVENTGSRTHFIRVTIDEKPNELTVIQELAHQGSHMLSSIVHADGYIVLEPGDILEPGDLIEVKLFH